MLSYTLRPAIIYHSSTSLPQTSSTVSAWSRLLYTLLSNGQYYGCYRLHRRITS